MLKSPLGLLSAWAAFFRYPNYRESRLGAVSWYSWFVTLGILLTFQGVPPLDIAVKTLATMVLITIFVYLLNDVMDANMDKFNPSKSKRPIPSGIASKGQALSLSLISGVLGLLFAFTINLLVVLFALLFMGLGVVYSTPPIRLKNKLLMKELVLGIGFAMSPLIGGSSRGSFSFPSLFAGIFLFISALTFYPTFEDATDIEDDKLDGCRTLAMILDQKKRLELTILGITIIMIVTPLTYVHFGFNTICPILVSAGCLLFLRYLFPLLFAPHKIEKEILGKGRTFIRVFVLAVQVGFIMGALPLFQ